MDSALRRELPGQYAGTKVTLTGRLEKQLSFLSKGDAQGIFGEGDVFFLSDYQIAGNAAATILAHVENSQANPKAANSRRSRRRIERPMIAHHLIRNARTAIAFALFLASIFGGGCTICGWPPNALQRQGFRLNGMPRLPSSCGFRCRVHYRQRVARQCGQFRSG